MRFSRRLARTCVERETSSMSHHVIVLGGGVAGMSAAHELVERGFRVTVYEKGTVGGKARSFDVPSTGTNQRRDLPAEHGFRFFPGFYRHLPDTMKRIPSRRGRPNTVFDHLVQTKQFLLAPDPGRDLFLLAKFPSSITELRDAFMNAFDVPRLAIP